MPEAVADTSPLQYLHQTGTLDVLARLYDRVIVPRGVASELARGMAEGHDVPSIDALSWIEVRGVEEQERMLPEIGLGLGEREVLTIAAKLPGAVAILDDRWARHHAGALGINFTGTLGILLKAKQEGLVASVRPRLDQLQTLGFYLDAPTRAMVLRLAQEAT